MESTQTYNFETLEHFFTELGGTTIITNHLEMLLQFLVYYSEKEKVHGLYEVYCDISEFKQVLQQITVE